MLRGQELEARPPTRLGARLRLRRQRSGLAPPSGRTACCVSAPAPAALQRASFHTSLPCRAEVLERRVTSPVALCSHTWHGKCATCADVNRDGKKRGEEKPGEQKLTDSQAVLYVTTPSLGKDSIVVSRIGNEVTRLHVPRVPAPPSPA